MQLILDSLLFTIFLKVMTAHPDCATLDTSILDALHIMHDGKFLHIPVLDRGMTQFLSQACEVNSS